ncbi:glycosyltransferase family 2 protein [Oceanospirillum sediminis]|uniref:Glycosyltransferase family 2 protein n=1 Tax=Oceanospirillum sediminis TaxID=2760088 RepID=A0A839IN31_9GAMM|nr:glycosyltransferase family 2 protein [Oceanospirillum sediminis]MBB1486358.1 glycosyltransferase family 2 protein [Oceanospirillum sediminis]
MTTLTLFPAQTADRSDQADALLNRYQDQSSAQSKSSPQSPLLSVVIPMYNEEEVIEACHHRVCKALDQLHDACEVVYVDDGSRDNTWSLVETLVSPRHEIIALRLSRNFGKEAAMSAGLKAAKGQAVILLDADLQDPPELMPDMVAQWKKGYDVVDMQRRKRFGESWFKRTTAAAFYKLINRLCDMPIPQNVGDFRLLDRRVVDEINRLPERNRFMKGLFAWPGFNRTTLVFDRDPRQAGETKWNYTQLLNLAFEGISSFSTWPLRLATLAGLVVCLLATVLTMTGGSTVLLAVLLLGGVQLLSVGLLGEYVGRLFIEAKQRPLYLVMQEERKPASDTWPETDIREAELCQ